VRDFARVNQFAAQTLLLLEIAGVNVLLSGDNAVVVGMTIRNLYTGRRRLVAAAGILIAVTLQTAATFSVARTLQIPAVSLVAAVLLCSIAIRMSRGNRQSAPLSPPKRRGRGILASTAAVAGAYFAMSLDNILAVAAVGRGHPWLLIIGLPLSCAAIIPASLLIANLMQRYPLILTAGAALVAWVAGSMLAAAASHFYHFSGGRPAQIAIPSLTTAAVITSPLWWPCRDRQPAPKLRQRGGVDLK